MTGEITFEKVTVKLTIGNLTVIWDVSIQMVWRNCKVEGNSGESSNSVRRRRRKKYEAQRGIANISKEEYFLPSLVAKANLAPDIPPAWDLWLVEHPPKLLLFYRVIEPVSVLRSRGTVYRCLVVWRMSSSNFSWGYSDYTVESMRTWQCFSVAFPHDWLCRDCSPGSLIFTVGSGKFCCQPRFYTSVLVGVLYVIFLHLWHLTMFQKRDEVCLQWLFFLEFSSTFDLCL